MPIIFIKKKVGKVYTQLHSSLLILKKIDNFECSFLEKYSLNLHSFLGNLLLQQNLLLYSHN